jgi:hypothetical protein
MTFNIGQQNAGVINNVAGDQKIAGGQSGALAFGDPIDALKALRGALGDVELPEQTADAVKRDLDEVTRAIDRVEPDKKTAAGRLERLTGLLKSSGALVAAGASLMGPLQALGRWLGPLGEGLLKLLSAH